MKKLRMLSVILAVGLLMVLLAGCEGTDSILQALRAGDADQANRLYTEKVQADSKKEAEFSAAYTAELEQLYNDLNSGKITSDEAYALLDNYHAFQESASFAALTNDISALAFSKEMYDSAESYMEEGNYLSAMFCYASVLVDDTNYSAAAERKSEAYDSYITATVEQSESEAAAGEYAAAIATLNAAQQALSQSAVAAAVPDDTRLAEALQNVYRTETNAVLDDAAERFTANQDYAGAMAILEVAADEMEDEELKALLTRAYEYYQAFEPVSLVTLESFYYDEDLLQYKNEVTDNLGQTYTGRLLFTNDGFWARDEYTGRVTFKTLDFDHLSCRLILENSEKNVEQGGSMNLYLDGNLAYQSPDVHKGVEPIDIELDLNGAAELRIEMIYHVNRCIQLVNAYLSKDPAGAEAFQERA